MRVAFQKINQQQGAMFGVDARISLMIFAVLSVITGSIVTTNLSKIQAQSLSDEFAKMGKSIEGIHHDIEDDIHKSLIEPSDENAIAALFDPLVIKPGRPRARWLGPYIKYDSNFHPKYGKMLLTKAEENHENNCVSRNLCFLWLSFGSVPKDVVLHTNDIFDGENEDSPRTSGRIQWQEIDKKNNLWKVFYRVSKSLS